MKIGIDVGGSHIGLGVLENKKLIAKKEKDYAVLEEDMSIIVIKTIKELIQELINENIIEKESIESIGIAFPGTVSKDSVIKAENLGIENLNIVNELQTEYNCKIFLENDAKCAAIAEKEFGSLKNYTDCLFIIIGTGVGGAVFLEGKMLKPKRYSAFEIGHMAIQKDGIQCNCGRKGCFETYTSIKRLKQKIQKEFNLESIDGKVIREFMLQNMDNKKLNNILNTYIEYLAMGIANLINIFEPEVISIGGSFVHYKEILLDRLENKLKEKTELYNKSDIPKIVIAELKNDAGIIGAALQF